MLGGNKLVRARTESTARNYTSLHCSRDARSRERVLTATRVDEQAMSFGSEKPNMQSRVNPGPGVSSNTKTKPKQDPSDTFTQLAAISEKRQCPRQHAWWGEGAGRPPHREPTPPARPPPPTNASGRSMKPATQYREQITRETQTRRAHAHRSDRHTKLVRRRTSGRKYKDRKSISEQKVTGDTGEELLSVWNELEMKITGDQTSILK